MARTFNGKPGDLIQIFRGSYQHWAVYIGGQMVVHLVPEGGQSSGPLELLSSRAEVKREKLTDVVGHHHFKVNNLKDEEYDARDPSIIVKEACEMVGRVLSYSVVSYNCEHFAADLRYGKAESRQVQTAGLITGVVAVGVLAALGAALFSSLSSKEEQKEEEEDYRKRRRRQHQHWH
ncbi:phospholipase A and acyltransferase 4 isoform X1 [Pleuronectes platessa]|uniref:phospholipase A and acyltransferase 4 isoform X1 n=2 Tax=Pleuronectes platessa TaxID=8262 RepID=UPI00232A5ED8|nr:phospholipase A and acyltransferase 4 isoform X1 [Pleuronectes platessa]